jgi:UDP-3-O-[3-hydroxymyristoyl] glucosamine N-acyltransferase
MFTLKALADQFDLEIKGDANTEIFSIGTLANAGSGQLAFLANDKYKQQLSETKAGAVLLSKDNSAHCPCACLISKNPYVSFAQISQLFEQEESVPAGIHATAVVHPSAQIHESACIGPFVQIGEQVKIGAHTIIHSHCSIGMHSEVADFCELMPRVTLVKRVRLGQRVRIHSGAVLGADGFGNAMHQGQWIKIAQLGGVVVGDDCEIGANTTIDRGAIEDTILEENVRLDNQIQIAHNVRIGAHTAIAGCTGIAGSTTIGKYCQIGGGVGFVGHIHITDKVIIGGGSVITNSITEPGMYVSGTPFQSINEWRKNAARFKHLDTMARSLNLIKKSQE